MGNGGRSESGRVADGFVEGVSGEMPRPPVDGGGFVHGPRCQVCGAVRVSRVPLVLLDGARWTCRACVKITGLGGRV